MVVWSAVRPLFASLLAKNTVNGVIQRNMSDHHRVLPYQPSRWQWNKFKDLLHYYMLLGAIPLGGVILFSNVFVGPATLSEIPEGYVPKHWEYYRHPITRFLARYMLSSPQQEYEKFLHHLYEEDEKAKIRALEKQVMAKMAERNDYQAYYYRPISAKYHRMSKDVAEYIVSVRGD